jgi:long-chain acyl-CoA synthetase
MMRRSVTEYISHFAERGAEIAYVHRRGYRSIQTSYSSILSLSSQFARELEERGTGKGDRVLIWGENCAEWVAAFLGCTLRAVVAVPVDSTSPPDFAARIFTDTESKVIIASSALVPQITFSGDVLVLEKLRETLARHASTPYPAIAHELDDPVEIVFTSGTTSEPKGVVISHRNILASLVPIESEIKKYLHYERIFHPLRFLNLLPLSHVFGQFLGVFIPQLLGGTVFFQDTLNPSDLIQSIRRERISVCVAVPRIIDAMKEKITRDLTGRYGEKRLAEQLATADDEHFLRRWWRFRHVHRAFGWKFWAFISGGAALSEEAEEFWRRLGYIVIQGYGMTESTSLISLNHPFKLGRRSIGKVLPGRELKLDESGEILVRGDNVARAYWVGRNLQPVAGEEGWLRTGDLGVLDAEGNLYFKGRKKDVIVTPEGFNVYPEDLEAALRRQPEIRDCLVVALREGGNAVPAAAIIPSPADIGPEQLEQSVRAANSSLSEFQKIRHWMRWPQEDFPRTSTQKPRINVITEALQSAFSPAAISAAATGSSPALADIVAKVTKRSIALSPDAKLEDDLNLSSLDRVELLSALEDRYMIDLDDASFSQAQTVGDLEHLLQTSDAKRNSNQSKYPYSEWQMRWPVTWLRLAAQVLLVRPATFLLGKPRVVDKENLRGLRGPALFISNHVTFVDIGFLMFAVPLRYRYALAPAMNGELLRSMRYPPETLNWFRRRYEQLQWLLVVALFNVHPLPQRSNYLDSFENLGRVADRGYSVVVFPEGERTKTGHMLPFRSGIGLLAQKLNLPVVPMRIDGLFAIKHANRSFAPPNAITVRIGKPLRFTGAGSPDEIAQTLEKSVAAL